mgnify:CR=1
MSSEAATIEKCEGDRQLERKCFSESNFSHYRKGLSAETESDHLDDRLPIAVSCGFGIVGAARGQSKGGRLKAQGRGTGGELR